MAIKRIEQDLNDFYSAMQRGEKILSSFSDEFDSRLGSVKDELKSLGEMTKKLKCAENTPAAGLVNHEIEAWNKSLQSCAESAEKDIRGRQFMHRFEKTPLVLVFGVVKAGKSTLGNFIHGREFRNAVFDNFYKHIDPPEIKVEESAREDVKRKVAFDEKITESTCSIQFFQIPGLAWVDTPGIEANKKLAELAKKYVRYADVVVFLTNSAHPELRAAIEALQFICEKGKKVVVAISRSDEVHSEWDEKKDDIVDILVPKESRKQQEDSFLNTMKSKDVDTQDFEVISISTLLAKLAIEQQDDFNWEASHMGLFYRKLADVIGNEEIIELKKREPREQMNRSINAILGSENQKGSLEALINDMGLVRSEIKKKYEKLDPDEKDGSKLVSYIVDDVMAKLSSEIRDYVEKPTKKKTNTNAVQKDTGSRNKGPTDHHVASAMGLASVFWGVRETDNRNKGRNASAKKGPVEVSLADLQEEIQKTVENAMNEHIGQVIGDFEKAQYNILKTDDLKTTVSHKIKTNSYTITGRVPRRQDTTLGEDILGAITFGAYEPDPRYEMEECYRTVNKKVDLGPDTAPAKKALEEALQSRVEEYVKAELAALREQFFGQARSKMDELIQKLNTLKMNLKKYSY